MSQVRRYIDAKTGDYAVENGSFKGDNGFTSKVVLAWRTKLGSAQANPTFGSRLHAIKHADERGRILAESYGYEAIAHLANEVEGLKVTATISAPGRIDLEASGKNGEKILRANYTATVS